MIGLVYLKDKRGFPYDGLVYLKEKRRTLSERARYLKVYLTVTVDGGVELTGLVRGREIIP